MEKHKCRLCFKFFPNGTDMRSHMINLSPSSSSSEETHSSSSSGVEKFANLFFFGQNSNESSEWSKDPRKQVDERQVSSISDARTNEKELTFSLMMLSPDRWKSSLEIEIDDEEEEEEEEECEKRGKSGYNYNNRKYKCRSCEKVFRSYQALGGHSASHNKEKLLHHVNIDRRPPPRPQECPYCDRIFSSGQALGGHKRSHFIGESANSIRCSKYLGTIDLNLPALS